MGKGFWKIITWWMLITSATPVALQPGQKGSVEGPEFIHSIEKKLHDFGVDADKAFTSTSARALFRRWLFGSLDENKALMQTTIQSMISARPELLPDAQAALKAQYKISLLEKHYQIVQNILPQINSIPKLLAAHLAQNPALAAIDETLYRTYRSSFESIYAKTPEKPLSVAELITSSDNNQRMLINFMNNTIERFKHKALGNLLKAWLDEIKDQMTRHKAASLEEKNAILASKPADQRAKLAPIYESIWLDTHYRIINRLIEQERVVVKLFAEKIDKDKKLGAACSAIQQQFDALTKATQPKPLTPSVLQSFMRRRTYRGGMKGASHGPGG